MSALKSTAGPWPLNGVMALDTPMWIISIPGEQARIEVPDYSEASEGNARLIAAAPELLAALEWAVAIVQFDCVRPDDGHVCGPDAGCDGDCTGRAALTDGLRRARAAIAKATKP